MVRKRSHEVQKNNTRSGEVSTPITVNWHVWKSCNYSCKFCFSRFGEIRSRLTRQEAMLIPRMLKEVGVIKLNFAGGEPTLCPYLPELIRESKRVGLVTSMVTNASRITNEYLESLAGYLDWIAISIDSPDERTEMLLGRGNGRHVTYAIKVALTAKKLGIKLKINTVVTSLNWQDDFSELLALLQPERWKVFQILRIDGQNDDHFSQLSITEEQFLNFVNRHRRFNPVPENNDAMIDSYVMLDPRGHFYQNSMGRLVYSKHSILEVGVLDALAEVGWDQEKFMKRGGLYQF